MTVDQYREMPEVHELFHRTGQEHLSHDTYIAEGFQATHFCEV